MSNINPNSINGNYPIAGQDNDSQGFRDNFTNVKNNLTVAATEVTEIQTNALLKAPLAGTTLNNEMNNTVLPGIQILRASETILDHGPTISGATPISWADGHFQVLYLSGNTTLTFTNWITSGFYAKMRLWVAPASPGLTLTFPATITRIAPSVSNIANLAVTFSNVGPYMYEVSTFDNGINAALLQLI